MWSGPTRTSIVHTKWHLDASSRLTTIDMGQKVGGCCSLVTCLNCTVKIWTVINWTVITNPNRNRSPNPVLTVKISTIQISRGNFTVQNLIVHISYRYPCMLGSVYTLGTRHIIPVTACQEPDVQKKNITSGTRRTVSNTKCRDVSFFSAHKRPSHFFSYIPHKKTLFETDKWSTYCHWHMLSTAKSANVGFRPVVQLFARRTNPAMHLSRKIPFINS